MKKFVLPAILATAVGLAFLPAARADGVIPVGTPGYTPGYYAYVPPSYTYVPPSYSYVPPTYYVAPSYYSYSFSVPYPLYSGSRFHYRGDFRRGHEHHRR